MSNEIVEARARETFVSNVSAKPEIPITAKRNGGKGFWSFTKKHSPLLVIVALIITTVCLIFVSQSFMPFALVNRFIEEYNGAGVASILRSDSLLDTQLASTGTYFGLSENQRTAFKDSEIYPVDFDTESGPATALVYRDSSGDWRAVVPKALAPATYTHNSDNIPAEVANGLNSPIAKALNNPSIIPTGTPLSVEDALKRADFKDQYVKASKTWRGGNAGWYDSLEDLTEARLAIRRTRFNSWITASVSNVDEAWRKIASGKSNVSDGGISDFASYASTDADGNRVTETNAGSVDASSFSGATTVERVSDILNSKITTATKLAATAGCAGVEIMATLQTYMAAQQSLQYLNLATGYLEAVQGAQVNKNDGTPMNEYNKLLMTVDPETGKAPMESVLSAELFSGTPVPEGDESIKNVSFETLMSSLGTLSGDLNFTAKAFEACSYVKMGVASANFATTILEFVPVLGQGVKVFHIATKLVSRLALGVTVASITSFIVPQILTPVFKNVAKNVATEWTGPDYFNALASGANKYLGGNFQTGGGVAASKESLAAYTRVKNEVLASEAETERRTKSAFDASSRYTFLGSIVYSLIPLATSSGVGTTVKNLGSIFTSSVSSLLPSASAVAETNLMQSLGTCPIQNSIDAVCDAAGNRINIDPVNESLIKLTDEELRAKVLELIPDAFSGTTPDGRDIINPKSTLGKVALIPNQRVAPLGVPDATALTILKNTPSTLISRIVEITDLGQFMDGLTEAENMPWISGQAGVLSDSNPYREALEVSEEYIIRDRWKESAGLTTKSAVTSFLEDYYTENPLDNSREGVLARFSGLTKDEVIAAEETIEVLTYLASYDPSTRTYFVANEETLANLECDIMGLCFIITAPSKMPSPTFELTPTLASLPKKSSVAVLNMAPTFSI